MRVVTTAAMCALALTLPARAQDADKTPKDSVKLVVTGCVRDHLLRATDIETPEIEDAPPIVRDTFRLSGKKALLADLKRTGERQVSVTGYVRKMDLQEPGMKVKGGRVVIGAPSGDPRRPPLPDSRDRPVVLDVLGFEEGPGSCQG